jgi:SAM-dependent methyltransferase
VSSTLTSSVRPQPAPPHVGGPVGPAQSPATRHAYARDAALYDQRTAAYQHFRQEVVRALPVRPGDVVLDVGCGTGLCFAPMLGKLGPRGAIVGIDESPDMIALARGRVAEQGWHNVTLVQAPAETADLPVVADAAIFCAVHDVLQSPAALRAIVARLRPGAAVAATGGKWAPPWMIALNLQVRALHEPYVRSFDGFHRPWRHLERFLEDVRVVDIAFGAGYLAVGRVSTPR